MTYISIAVLFSVTLMMYGIVVIVKFWADNPRHDIR